MLAIKVDVTATNEDLQLGAGSWGTLYVGTTADGSLAGPGKPALPRLLCGR